MSRHATHMELEATIEMVEAIGFVRERDGNTVHWRNQEAERLRERVEALEKALGEYGTHRPNCQMKLPVAEGRRICTCGWEAARKLLPTAKPSPAPEPEIQS